MSEFERLYAAFEAQFRGSRELIVQRLQTYAPLLVLVEQRLPRPWHAIDYGCGRGEWLQLLGARGWNAVGVDANASMLREASALSLKVQRGDMIEHISGQSAESVALISAFHVVEHISQEDLFSFVRHAVRVLVPGGLLILETPNPENVAVGTSSFYLDPTHQRPIPPQLLQFVVQQAGFDMALVVRLNGEPGDPSGRTLEHAIRPMFSRALDYAVVASRSDDPAWLSALASEAAAVTQMPPIDLEALHHVSELLSQSTERLPSDLRDALVTLAEANERSIGHLGDRLERLAGVVDERLDSAWSDGEAKRALQSALEAKQDLLSKWKELVDARADFAERERSAEARYQALLHSTSEDRERLVQLAARISHHDDELAGRDAASARAQERAAALEAELHSTRQHLQDACTALAACERVVAQMQASRSWRITRPLRASSRWLHALRGRLQGGRRKTLVQAFDWLALLVAPVLRPAVRHPRSKRLLRGLAGRWPRVGSFVLERLRATGLLPTPVLAVGPDGARQGLSQDIEQLLANVPPRSRALYLALQEDLTSERATKGEHAASD